MLFYFTKITILPAITSIGTYSNSYIIAYTSYAIVCNKIAYFTDTVDNVFPKTYRILKMS